MRKQITLLGLSLFVAAAAAGPVLAHGGEDHSKQPAKQPDRQQQVREEQRREQQARERARQEQVRREQARREQEARERVRREQLERSRREGGPFDYLPREDITRRSERPYRGYIPPWARADAAARHARRGHAHARQSGFENDQRRRALANRADAIQDRAERLYRDGRLSGEHYERVLDKLDRTRDVVRNDSRIDPAQFQAQQQLLSGVERDLSNWSRGYSRSDRHGRDRHRDHRHHDHDHD